MGRVTKIYCDVCGRELKLKESYYVISFVSSKWVLGSNYGNIEEPNSLIICELHKDDDEIKVDFWRCEK